MKCWICNKDMKNTIGGCYHCQDCGTSVNDGVFRTEEQSINKETFYKKGWVCPKCGAVMSPNQPYCMFCQPKANDVQITTTGIMPTIDLNTKIISKGE